MGKTYRIFPFTYGLQHKILQLVVNLHREENYIKTHFALNWVDLFTLIQGLYYTRKQKGPCFFKNLRQTYGKLGMMKAMQLFKTCHETCMQLMQIGTRECIYYMLNLLCYFKARQKGSNVILEGGKCFRTKDAKQLQVKIYGFVEEEMMKEWKKLFSCNKSHEDHTKFSTNFTIVK